MGRRHRPRHTRWIAALGCSAAIALASMTSIGSEPSGFDPSLAHRIQLGGAPGIAANPRVDRDFSGRVTGSIPTDGAKDWRRSVGGAMSFAPAIDALGHVYATIGSPELVKVTASGKEAWRFRLPAAPAAGPAISGVGDIVVVTKSGEVVGLTPDGHPRFRTMLSVRGEDVISVASTPDGGIAVVAGRDIVTLGPFGAQTRHAVLPARATTSALSHGGELLVGAADGRLYAVGATGEPRSRGDFGGAPRVGLTRLDARTVAAVVDDLRVVAIDVPTGTSQRLAEAPGLAELEAPLAANDAGVFVADRAGTMIAVDRLGTELMRVPLELSQGGFVPSTPMGGVRPFGAPSAAPPSPPLLVDADARVAFVRKSGRLGVVDGDGRVTTLGERLCSQPIAVLPAGPERLLVACQDGTLWTYAGVAAVSPPTPAGDDAEGSEDEVGTGEEGPSADDSTTDEGAADDGATGDGETVDGASEDEPTDDADN